MSKPQWWIGPIAAYLSMLATMLLLSAFGLGLELPSSIIASWITYAVPVILIFCFVFWVEKRGFWKSVGVRKKNLGLSLIWVFALLVIFGIISVMYWKIVNALMGVDPGEIVAEHFEQIYPDWYFGYMAFASFVPIGLFEELIFRGYTLDRFLKKGAVFALLSSSILFTSLHLWYAGFGRVGVPLYGSTFLISLCFGVAYLKTRNIIGLAIMHGLLDAELSINHFYGSVAVEAMNVGMFAIGIACLGYLVFRYVRGKR